MNKLSPLSTPSITNTYDALGNLSQVIDTKGTTVFTYNNYGNVISEAIEGIYSKVLTKSYDSFGRNIGYELDNIPKASYSYHANAGRLTQMLPEGFGEPFTFMYQANSHLLESIIGPIVTQTVEYEDARDLIKSVTHSGNVGTHYATYSYTNDLLGRRTTKTQNFNNEVKDFDFGYNPRSEVTSANQTGNTNYQYGFGYDNIGNRISANENGIPKSYVANALNQYTNVDTTFSPTYDSDGNQTKVKTSSGIWNIIYNAENRPVKFIQGNTFISMSYDYMGRRFEKTVIVEGNIETSQKFVYNDYLQIEELNENNESIKSYLWDPIAEDESRPLMLTDHALEQSFFFTHDANKNVTDLIDEGGMVAVHYEYSPFGAITLNTNPSFYNSFTFSSEYFDSELGLIYYNYRHYNSMDGRWISRDPIEEEGGYNLYGMCVNNLINYCDLFGKSFINCMGDCISDNLGHLWDLMVSELAVQGMLEGLISIPFSKTGLIEFAKKIGLPDAVRTKIMVGLQNGSVDKTTGVRLINIMIRSLFKEFGLHSPITVKVLYDFGEKIPKHMMIAAGLIIGTIDLYCAQTCCLLAWHKLSYTDEFSMVDNIINGWKDILFK